MKVEEVRELGKIAQEIWEADHEDRIETLTHLQIFRSKPGGDWVAIYPGRATFIFHTDEDAHIDIYEWKGKI